jgi:hypothetical protein
MSEKSGVLNKNNAKSTLQDLNFFARTGRQRTIKKEPVTEGMADFNLKISRATLADLAIIISNHFKPKNKRERQYSKEEIMVFFIEKTVNSFKRRFPNDWKTIISETIQHPKEGGKQNPE